MRSACVRAGILLLAVAALAACPSAYQRTFDQETQKLETHRQAQEAAEAAAHAEAKRYAAVIYFDPGSAVVQEDGARELGWFADKIKPYPEAMLEVQGFADSTGSDALNENLSKARAEAVAAQLMGLGIERARLVLQGFGSNYAAASNQDAKGRRNNRRVEVTVR
ncbi:MAG: OmpA family protein [Myxococcota bacterium]